MCSIHITYGKALAIGGDGAAGNGRTVAGEAVERESLSFSKRSYGLDVCLLNDVCTTSGMPVYAMCNDGAFIDQWYLICTI